MPVRSTSDGSNHSTPPGRPRKTDDLAGVVEADVVRVPGVVVDQVARRRPTTARTTTTNGTDRRVMARWRLRTPWRSSRRPSSRSSRRSSSCADRGEPGQDPTARGLGRRARRGRSGCRRRTRRSSRRRAPAADARPETPPSSTTSTMTTVMLSRPPCSLARRTSSRAASSGSSMVRSTSAMSSSVDLVGEAVGAQQVAVAGVGEDLEVVDRDLVASMPRARVTMLRLGVDARPPRR